MATAAERTELELKLVAVQADLKADIARVESKVDALESKADRLARQADDILILLRQIAQNTR
jgi:tetrahydromethanopterin S-methyltransferase subunit F